MPAVQVIPAKKTKIAVAGINITKRRVAGYARVSSDTEEQLNSYEAQVSYYTETINAKPDWELVKVYTDEGISAVNTKRREGFKAMINDALDGKIDLIVTKSVSRFARNTVDSLSTIRKLKEKGVECYFEKENIWTFDNKGELLITIMSSLAQEESRSISENVTWGKRKSMADGKISLPWSSFLGYEKGEDGLPKIVPEQAVIVQRIFKMYMSGLSFNVIAKQLTANGIPTPKGKKVWQMATVRSILQNETYRGSKRLQKTLTVDFLTKQKKINNGELPMFYIEKSHEPIIPPDEWDAVQVEIERRKVLGRPLSCHSPFATRIICGECGGYFGSKLWGSNTKYKRTVWQCNDKYKEKGMVKCTTPHISEDQIKDGFITAFNKLMSTRDNIIDDCCLAQKLLCDTDEIDKELVELEHELEIVDALAHQSIEENKRSVIDQAEWSERNVKYLQRYDNATNRIEELTKQKNEKIGKSKMLELFIKSIEQQELVITDFDESVWNMSIDKAIVGSYAELTFKFKNGVEITV